MRILSLILLILTLSACSTSKVATQTTPLTATTPPPKQQILYLSVFSTEAQDRKNALFLINTDGSDQTQLVDWGKVDNPAWSPDGSQIAFVEDGQIYLAKMDGSKNQPFTKLSKEKVFFLAWSPNGKQIAFITECEQCNNLYIADIAGNPAIPITDGVLKPLNSGYKIGPVSWSDDGHSIAYDYQQYMAMVHEEPKGGIVVQDTRTADQHYLFGEQPSGNDPSWSPNRQEIAFISSPDQLHSEMYISDADGKNKIQLTKTSYFIFGFAWSPDGSKIIFNSTDFQKISSIYVIDHDGYHQKLITENGGCPSWSPDGQNITFISDRDGSSQVYTIGVDGSNAIKVTSDTYYKVCPKWRPQDRP